MTRIKQTSVENKDGTTTITTKAQISIDGKWHTMIVQRLILTVGAKR